MGGACSTYGGQKRCIQGFGGDTRGKETTWKTPGINGRIILRYIFEKWDVKAWTGMIWRRIRTDGGHFVNVVMNIRVP